MGKAELRTDINPDDYHALPGFSASIAKVVIAKSPAHAKEAAGRPPSKLLDRGSVIHRLVLGKGKDYVMIEGDDWRTKAAKEAREAARAQGLIPVLAHELADYTKAAASIIAELADRGIVLDGLSEAAAFWTEETEHGPVACRGMFDHVWPDRGLILDLKVTADASPSSVERTSENLGYAIQEAAYTRALARIRPDLTGRIKFLFAFCEAEPPYAINICAPDGVFREIGERRWMRAVNEWAKCQATGVYPAYGTGVNQLNAPGWALARDGYTFDER